MIGGARMFELVVRGGGVLFSRPGAQSARLQTTSCSLYAERCPPSCCEVQAPRVQGSICHTGLAGKPDRLALFHLESNSVDGVQPIAASVSTDCSRRRSRKLIMAT